MALAGKRRYVIGIDEVGRGPLAGPLVVGAVVVPAGLKLGRGGLRDSKKLTAQARSEWAEYIQSHPRLGYALARVSAVTVDRVNVARAANLAARRAFTRLAKEHKLRIESCSVYLDGGLYLGNGRARLPAKTVIKGDEKVRAIALASIVAKVHRDRIMVRAAKKFPGYGLEVHKGYGTRTHRTAVRRLGPTPLHRLTFIKKYPKLTPIKSHGRRTDKTS
jgi:ribonuclease HII